jgi:hypothetical protein
VDPFAQSPKEILNGHICATAGRAKDALELWFTTARISLRRGCE